MVHAIETFIENVREIEEPDYGDFMRRAGSYLADLDATLAPLGARVHQQIEMMRNYLMFHPSWGIEGTRARLLSDAEELARIATEKDELPTGELISDARPEPEAPMHAPL